MTTPAKPDETPAGAAEVPAAVPNGPIIEGPPFGPAFFMSILADRVRQQCDQSPASVPVVELHLADGAGLDLCHVPGVGPQWIAAEFYRDRQTCQEMDVSFIPYGLITRVTISMWHRKDRPAGFDLSRPAVSV